MFTGIVADRFKICSVQLQSDGLTLGVAFEDSFLEDIQIGASISIDGVCLTVVRVDGAIAYFDLVEETLTRSTLKNVAVGRVVNAERAARLGFEVGGHLLSGHIMGQAEVVAIQELAVGKKMTIACPQAWMKWILEKGYIGLDGVSLTVVDAEPRGAFSVALIPETLNKTTLGLKQVGDSLNVEIDPQTQLIVKTVERMLASYTAPSLSQS